MSTSRFLALMALALGALAACGTNEPVPFEIQPCCVLGRQYLCNSVEALGRCQATPADPSLCADQHQTCVGGH
jgi:hypothetical protein